MRITAEHIIRFIQAIAARIHEQRDYLTQLDSAIGDADHGSNLDRGFSAVLMKLPTAANKDIGTILKTTGMTLISTVGGAAGPLYGTAFLRAGLILANRTEVDNDELIMALEDALDGIMTRGKAQRGEKTLIDTIAPAIDAYKAAHTQGLHPVAALRAAVSAAENGMLATISMLATKGRASYLGERSIGHQDPGATSAYLMVSVLIDLVENSTDQ